MRLMVLLRQAAHDLRIRTVGPVNVAVGQGEVFRYFDVLRQIIESAKTDIFFVDRYLGPDFVSKYLPHVSAGVTVRLLTRDQVPALVSAASAFAKEFKTNIEVRSSNGTGASFKDGGRKDTTTITQNVDGFAVLSPMYEDIWQSAADHKLLS